MITLRIGQEGLSGQVVNIARAGYELLVSSYPAARWSRARKRE
jgi:hypothetical protein